MAYEIEDGIPLPEKRAPRGISAKYPFAGLAVGQSFFARDGKTNCLSACARAWAKRNDAAARFTVRKVDGGVRVRRVE